MHNIPSIYMFHAVANPGVTYLHVAGGGGGR